MKYKFLKYQSLFDDTVNVYALENDAVEKFIDGVKFIEVTPDFKTAQFVRADSLKQIGWTEREY